MKGKSVATTEKRPKNNKKEMVLALDPGKTTGWSIWKNRELIQWGQASPQEVCKIMENFNGLIVYERFILRKSAASAMIGSEFGTVQLIGAIRYIALKKGLSIIGQTPAQRKWFDNEKLKRYGVYKKGQQHAVDSIRHALYYFVFTDKSIGAEEFI